MSLGAAGKVVAEILMLPHLRGEFGLALPKCGVYDAHYEELRTDP